MLYRLPIILALIVTPALAQQTSQLVTQFQPNALQSIVGHSVYDGSNTDIGPIVDVLVDRAGRPRAAIVDVGGFLGVGTRRVAVAWKTLHFVVENGDARIVDHLTMDEVAAAPEFKGTDAPIQAAGHQDAEP